MNEEKKESSTSVADQVEKLTALAKETGVGIICSGNEAKIVRKVIGPNLLIFTPDIRMLDEKKNDQQRVCTPKHSIKNGLDKIVMGRSPTKGDVLEDLDKVLKSLKK